MPITLAQLIREARIRFNIPRTDLAKSAGCSLENISSIETGRNRQPSPEVNRGLAQVLDLKVEDLYAAIAGTLNHFPWERAGDLDLKDPELELMFRQVDSILDEEAKRRVKAFILFTLDEERKRRRRETEAKKQTTE